MAIAVLVPVAKVVSPPLAIPTQPAPAAPARSIAAPPSEQNYNLLEFFRATEYHGHKLGKR